MPAWTSVLLVLLVSAVGAVQTGLRTGALAPALVKAKPVLPADLVATQATDAVFCKLKSVSRRRLDVYAEQMDGANVGAMKLVGTLASGACTSMAMHDKQHIHFTLSGCPEAIEGSFVLSSQQSLYGVGRGMESSCPELLQELQEEQDFSAAHEAKTGQPWRHHYGFLAPHFGPRGRPSTSSAMWPADKEGQLHTVKTRHVYAAGRGSGGAREGGSPAAELQLTLQVVSTSPRVFAIKNFMSLEEVDELVELGKTRGNLSGSMVGSSTMGGTVSDKEQRSSSTAWLAPDSAPLLKTIYARAADLLQVPSAVDFVNYSEHMQLVHYAQKQHYSAHFDFEITSAAPQSRFATLLLYLNDQAAEDAGGETAFPLARMADGSRGFKIHPGKGNAVLFYNLLPDGNADVQSLHAALPVVKGEKWAANIWLWG